MCMHWERDIVHLTIDDCLKIGLPYYSGYVSMCLKCSRILRVNNDFGGAWKTIPEWQALENVWTEQARQIQIAKDKIINSNIVKIP